MIAPTRRASEVFERHFLEVRCKLLEIAATLDRIDRADDPERSRKDARYQNILEALSILAGDAPNRAELVQLLFSRGYDPHWIAEHQQAKG